MLVLTRKLDESIQLGNDIKITVLRIKGNTVRIGIEAPRDVRVIRSELEPTEVKPATDRKGLNDDLVGTGDRSTADGAIPHVYIGSVDPAGENPQLRLDGVSTGDAAAPLRGFFRGVGLGSSLVGPLPNSR